MKRQVYEKFMVLLGIIVMCETRSIDFDIEIKPIAAEHLENARAIIARACLELQIVPCSSLEDVQRTFQETQAIADLDSMEEINKTYNEHNGLFLVMLHNQKIIGMGAVKQVDDVTCELKRMFFDAHYRGKGLGSCMLQRLIEEAQKLHYKKMRLDVYNPKTQIMAVNLYKKFGFYEIAPYKDDRFAQLFMAKDLAI